MTGTEAKKLRESFGLSQSDTARNLGYANRFAISRIEGYEEVPEMYKKALENLCELMVIKSNSIKNTYEFGSSEYKELIFAQKDDFIRRIYSNNEEDSFDFAERIKRKVKTRKNKLYKYEIIVF